MFRSEPSENQTGYQRTAADTPGLLDLPDMDGQRTYQAADKYAESPQTRGLSWWCACRHILSAGHLIDLTAKPNDRHHVAAPDLDLSQHRDIDSAARYALWGLRTRNFCLRRSSTVMPSIFFEATVISSSSAMKSTSSASKTSRPIQLSSPTMNSRRPLRRFRRQWLLSVHWPGVTSVPCRRREGARHRSSSLSV